jgi:hypothetical protein
MEEEEVEEEKRASGRKLLLSNLLHFFLRGATMLGKRQVHALGRLGGR